MRRFCLCAVFIAALLISFVLSWQTGEGVRAEDGEAKDQAEKSPAYTGTSSCRKCHEKFYKLWAPSHHGLAMQPYTKEFAEKSLTPQTEDIKIGDYSYRADITGDEGWVRENGPDGEKKYAIVHALGGKNVYYFLTSMDKGAIADPSGRHMMYVKRNGSIWLKAAFATFPAKPPSP